MACLAGPRGSVNYAVTAETTNSGGNSSTSASYANIGTMGCVAGESTVAVPLEKARHGYIGQLTEVAALQLAATPTTVNEAGSSQINATATLDDSTTVLMISGGLVWNVLSGPIASVSAVGVATASIVYETTAATVVASYLGQSGTLVLTVQDTIPDNFGTYAGDGLPDLWQVQTMGLNGTMGGPTLDPDGDGIPNLLEYAIHLNPLFGNLVPATLARIGDFLEYSYTRNKAALTGGTQFHVEWSETLQPSSWGDSGVMEEIVSDDGTMQQMKATLAAGTGGRRFVRLRVE